jgi:hypothetical protein
LGGVIHPPKTENVCRENVIDHKHPHSVEDHNQTPDSASGQK